MIELLLAEGLTRIGHKGAAALAPENTLRSLEAAVEAGVDVVEFDVLPSLVLGHSPHEIPLDPISLDAALAFLRDRPVGLHVDVKGRGAEVEIVEALRAHGLEERVYVTSTESPVLRRFAELAPEVPRGYSYPRDRVGISRGRWLGPARRGGALALRQALPRRLAGLLAAAAASVASLHHAVVSRAVVERAHALGVPVIAWTVDAPGLLARMERAGVDAVVTNDPAIFEARLPA